MSTGFTLDQVPERRGLGDLRPRFGERGPSGVRRDPRSPRRPAGRPAAVRASAFLPAAFQGTAFNADKPTFPHLARPADAERRGRMAATRDFLKPPQRPAPGAEPRRHRPPGRARSPQPRELAARMQLAAAGRARTCSQESESTAQALRSRRRREHREERVPPRTAFWPAGSWSGTCGSCSSSTAPTRWAKGWGTGTGTRRSRSSTAFTAPILDQPCRRPAGGYEAAGADGGHALSRWSPSSAGCRRSRRGANGRDHNPKGFTCWLAGRGWKRAFSYGATDEFGYQGGGEGRPPSMTCMPRCCTSIGLDPRAAELLPQR